ncbi:MAG: UDP-N-acetylmuramate:L-alanyl-gamma-D-glutamyl-meso-diaminopimelate ligase [Candidatus Hydrogenedentota bacterium]|nr:MAG: UDP-N-acetylmuramate:L-alanyl-gamma-D-glutamyl-meso-diaminopimelate ligase [Candidatus Hydrogenedentota bacterium]
MLHWGDQTAPKVHFSGMGGTGMVSVARLALEAGWEVRGSDNPLYPPTSEMVEALGVPLAAGYSAVNLDWGPDVVVIGNALSRGNPEVEAVLNSGLHYMSFPEFLKDTVLRRRKPISICGTHGKTTTTAITSFLLDKAGLKPGFLIGGQPLDFTHASRLGQEDGPFVVEGDEYDTAFFDKRAKFFHYLPHIAVVTSLEFDHADIYEDLEAIEKAFRLMLRQIPETGHLILCSDDPGALALKEHAPCTVHTYGISENADWVAEPGTIVNGIQSFTVKHHDSIMGTVMLPMAGKHNMQNAMAALIVGTLHGIPFDTLVTALSSFKGIKRRMEIFHQAQGITFVDDFAHHPTAIRETIAAARSMWPDQRLTVLFEPRSNTTATNTFQSELAESMAGADRVVVGPIHRPERYTDDTRLDRNLLAADIENKGTKVTVADSADAIVKFIRASASDGDVILILSNGAFDGIYEKIRAVFD